MHWSLSTLSGLVLLGIALAVILYEATRNRTGPRFPSTDVRRTSYWATYLSFIVLGCTILLATVIRY